MDELTLHRYLDGRLDEQHRTAVEEALRADPSARRTLDALREEARLIGAALEVQVEPSYRLGDRVVAKLHLEERSRASAQRTRRFFWRVGLGRGAGGGSIALCFFLVMPRTAAGSFLSGTEATVVVHGEKRAAQKGTHVYDGDGVETAKGQFVRIGLAGGQRIDALTSSQI